MLLTPRILLVGLGAFRWSCTYLLSSLLGAAGSNVGVRRHGGDGVIRVDGKVRS